MIKKKLIEFAVKSVDYLNNENLKYTVGKYHLELSTRTISDVIEKYLVNYAIDYFGKENIEFGNYNGYDVIILNIFKNKIYVNIKTNLTNQHLDASWLASASVIDRFVASGICSYLYCIKLEYSKESSFIRFLNGKVAGPVSQLNLIKFTKGEISQFKIRTEFNGTHYHILNNDYE